MIDDPVVVNDWHPVARSEDIEEGGDPISTRLLEHDLVVWRSDGELLAWQDLCLHRGTRLSMGEIKDDGTLMCPYHGWTYNTEGQCVQIPAHPDQPPPSRFKVNDYHVTEKFGLVWVCLGEPEYEIPPLPEYEDEEYLSVFCGPYEFDAFPTRAVENFLDFTHFPYVHEGVLGDRDETAVDPFEVDRSDDGIRADNIKVWQPDPDSSGEGKYLNYSFSSHRPFNGVFEWTPMEDDEDKHYKGWCAVQPVEKEQSIMWSYLNMSYDPGHPVEEIQRRQDAIISDDRPIVESQRPELLPLDLQAELHRPSDRVSIAYRKWLRSIGISFGTS